MVIMIIFWNKDAVLDLTVSGEGDERPVPAATKGVGGDEGSAMPGHQDSPSLLRGFLQALGIFVSNPQGHTNEACYRPDDEAQNGELARWCRC